MDDVEYFQATWTVLEYRNVGEPAVPSSEMGDSYMDGGWEFLRNWQEPSAVLVPGPTDQAWVPDCVVVPSTGNGWL